MDEIINLSVTPQCKICGGTGIIIPDNPTDDSVITCPNCGATIGTHGEFKAHVELAAVGVVEDMVKDLFKGLPSVDGKK